MGPVNRGTLQDLESKVLELEDPNIHLGTSMNHVDGFLDFFDPPPLPPHVDHFTK